MVKRPTIRLKPAECSIWPGNARDYEQLTEPRLRSLIESIQAENGNRIPVVVRRKQQGELQYELIIGTRRHWAVAWLNANHYPDIELVAIIEDLDDEAAFRLADIENREREDISDLERGLNYKAAVDTYYDGLQARLAERVCRSPKPPLRAQLPRSATGQPASWRKKDAAKSHSRKHVQPEIPDFRKHVRFSLGANGDRKVWDRRTICESER